eukprot:TRINITY_DN39568_c0_g1_i1.p1 TRINITY_DN39568_c0_g1~~TRINITY_DN39568_c0_g1_i1.p1  ORF type:complete len:215 (+),score=26.95 TRINITY_DN39568_c0_g1_i1:47-691(+)
MVISGGKTAPSLPFASNLKALPDTLDEPYIYLSGEQRSVVRKYSLLSDLEAELPCWVPQRRIACALGFDDSGMNLALKELRGRAYVWATEFENVHTLWRFQEPSFEIRGKVYASSEIFFHSQKPEPFDKQLWDGVDGQEGRRVGVMREAVRAKFAQSSELRALLIATNPHPLLSVKGDSSWGFDPRRGGENMLAKLLMELREELVHEQRAHGAT